MRGQQERSGSLFSCVSIEDRIPENHPLRRIRRLANQALDRLNPTFCQLYASEGRPSVPPEPLLLASLLQALWRFLEMEGIEPTNNAAEPALRQSVIQRKISHGVQSRQGAICRSRLLTVTTTLRQQGRDVRAFLEQAWITHHPWIAHHRGGVMPSLLPHP